MKKTLLRALCLAAALLIVTGALTSCGLNRNSGTLPEESVTDESSQAAETRTQESTSAYDPANYSEAQGADVYEGVWHDKYSNKCDMTVSHIGGNYYDISLRWGTICWSLLGTYNAENGSMDYTGKEFEMVLEDTPSMDVIDENCEGSFTMTDDEIIRWSDREKCKFVFTKDCSYTDDFAVISDEDSFAFIYDSTEDDGSAVAALPAGVTVNVIEREEEFAEIICCEARGYIRLSRLADTGLVFDSGDLQAEWADDIEDAPEPAFSASDSYYADDVAFIAKKPLTGFKILALSNPVIDDEGNLTADTEEVYSVDRLEGTLVVTLLFEGSIPNNAISYVDQYGSTHRYTVSESGRDGSIVLSEF